MKIFIQNTVSIVFLSEYVITYHRHLNSASNVSSANIISKNIRCIINIGQLWNPPVRGAGYEPSVCVTEEPRDFTPSKQ